MEYICLQGILVGVNCQPEDVAGGGVCVCVRTRARASYPPAAFFFPSWSLVINQDGGVRGKNSPSANWRTLSQRVSNACLPVCSTKEKKEMMWAADWSIHSDKIQFVHACVCVGTIQTYKRDLGLTVQYFGSFKKEQPCPRAVRCCSGQLGCMLACLTHAAHYQSCTEGSGQGCSVRKYLWGLDLFFCFVLFF